MNFSKENWNKEDKVEFENYLESLKLSSEKIKRTTTILQTKFRVLAIPTKTLKDIANSIMKGNYESFLKLQIYSTYESLAINGFIISHIKNFSLMKNYLIKYSKFVDSWATCDLLSFNVKNNETLFLELIKEFINSDKKFRRRIGYRILFKFINSKYLNQIFKFIIQSKNEKEYYVNMIISWLLCECFIKYRNETLNFIITNNLNNFVFIKFIQKCKDSYRVSKEDKKLLSLLKIENKHL